MDEAVTPSPIITTLRLTLRPVTPQDSGRITEVVADPRVHRMLARVPPGQTKAQTLAWIMTHDRGRAEDIDHVYAITKDGLLLGVTGAHRASTDLPFEIGYWLAPEAWGQGFVTEASAALIRWLETSRGARALVFAAAGAIAFAIGASRVYLGVHYPTDIIGGWSLGAAWAAIVWIAARRFAR